MIGDELEEEEEDQEGVGGEKFYLPGGSFLSTIRIAKEEWETGARALSLGT